LPCLCLSRHSQPPVQLVLRLVNLSDNTLPINPPTRPAHTAARQLLQTNTRCPAGCNIAGGGCVSDATSGGYKCTLCLNNLVADEVDGVCKCLAGRYALNADDCTDCSKGSWCEGGTYTAIGTPGLTNCTTDLTTIGKRSTSIKSCGEGVRAS
jgi:hypothetical protein